MKIVYVGKYFYPYFGGIETVSEQLCRGMSEHGHDISILACHERLFAKKRYTKNAYEVIKLRSMGQVLSVPLCLWSVKLINSLNPDVVHFHLPNPLPLFLLNKIKGFKVATYHASILNKGIAGKLYLGKYKEQLKCFDKIIVTSKNTTNEVNFVKLDVSKNKLIEIPLGIKLEKRKKPEKNNPLFKLVFSGRLVEYKGLEYLIKAMQKVDAELLIIGDGPLKNKLVGLTKKYSLSNKVKFKPPMQRDELLNLVNTCDLFVLPSISEAEAFGMSALEAMSLGVPVVTTWLNSGVSEVNVDGKTGVIVEPKSVNSLAEGINKVLDKSTLSLLGLNARARYLEKYTLKKMISAHLDLYESF